MNTNIIDLEQSSTFSKMLSTQKIKTEKKKIVSKAKIQQTK